MNVETINETINSSRYIGQERKVKVIEGEMIVPDIKPDILSLINIDNDVYITKCSVETDKVEINGVMEVNVLYISEDSNRFY